MSFKAFIFLGALITTLWIASAAKATFPVIEDIYPYGLPRIVYATRNMDQLVFCFNGSTYQAHHRGSVYEIEVYSDFGALLNGPEFTDYNLNLNRGFIGVEAFDSSTQTRIIFTSVELGILGEPRAMIYPLAAGAATAGVLSICSIVWRGLYGDLLREIQRLLR